MSSEKAEAVSGAAATGASGDIEPASKLEKGKVSIGCASGYCPDCRCYCNVDLDEKVINTVARGDNFLGKTKLELLAAINIYMKKYEITQCLEKAHFLAQAMHESVEFSAPEEFKNAHWKSYRGGEFYHGRGYMQLTGDDTYRLYLAYANNIFSNDTVISIGTNFDYALDSAFWFWKKFKTRCSMFSLKNDFIGLTYVLNGGFNGIEIRKKNLQKLEKIMCIKNCPAHKDKKFDKFNFLNSQIHDWKEKYTDKEGKLQKRPVKNKWDKTVPTNEI